MKNYRIPLCLLAYRIPLNIDWSRPVCSAIQWLQWSSVFFE